MPDRKQEGLSKVVTLAGSGVVIAMLIQIYNQHRELVALQNTKQYILVPRPGVGNICNFGSGPTSRQAIRCFVGWVYYFLGFG